jgi:hypothetical protein
MEKVYTDKLLYGDFIFLEDMNIMLIGTKIRED